jgi:hypothetical protein
LKSTKNPYIKESIEAVVDRVKGKGLKASETTMLSITDEFEDRVLDDSESIKDREVEIYLSIPDKLRDGWNFHNDIAIDLEFIARHTFGDRDRPYTKIYDADAIEGGMFAEVMMDVLRERTGRENNRDDVDEFIKICSRFIGKGSCEMDHRVAQALLDKFRELVGE